MASSDSSYSIKNLVEWLQQGLKHPQHHAPFNTTVVLGRDRSDLLGELHHPTSHSASNADSSSTSLWAEIGLAALMSQSLVERVLSWRRTQPLMRACAWAGLFPTHYDSRGLNTDLWPDMICPAVVQMRGGVCEGEDAVLSQERGILSRAILSGLTIWIGDGAVLVECFGLIESCLAQTQSQTQSRSIDLAANSASRAKIVWVRLLGPSSSVSQKCHVQHGQHNPHFDRLNQLAQKFPDQFHIIDATDANDEVFWIELAMALNCFPTQALQHPEQHWLSQLEGLGDFPKSLPNMLRIAPIQQQLSRELEYQQHKSKDPSWLLVQGRYDEMIAKYPEPGTDSEKNAVAWANLMQGIVWSDLAHRQHLPQRYEMAFAKFAKAIEVKPAMHQAFNSWGVALLELADAKFEPNSDRQHESESEFEFESEFKTKCIIEASSYFATASGIQPNDHDVWNNWGFSLVQLASTHSDRAAVELAFAQAFQKFAKPSNSNPNFKRLGLIGDWHCTNLPAEMDWG